MSELISILIPVHESHHEKFQALHHEILRQIGFGKHDVVEVYPYLNKGDHSKGHYRNELLDWAKGEYLCFVDADDWVSEDYISTLLAGVRTNPTHISLRGEYTVNGQSPELFEHSIKYQSWKTNDTGLIKYERTVNHLNCIKSSIAKQFKFPDISHGEDHNWANQLQRSGLLTQEYYTDKLLYHYKYVKK